MTGTSKTDELIIVRQREWNAISDTYFTSLIDSMSARATALKLKNGKPTKYQTILRNVK